MFRPERVANDSIFSIVFYIPEIHCFSLQIRHQHRRFRHHYHPQYRHTIVITTTLTATTITGIINCGGSSIGCLQPNILVFTHIDLFFPRCETATATFGSPHEARGRSNPRIDSPDVDGATSAFGSRC